MSFRLCLWICSLCFSGEGYHNYHHTFPFDYATSEFGYRLNITTAFIDLMCFMGLARDPKKVSEEMIIARIQRTGDGSHKSGWVTKLLNSPYPIQPRQNVAAFYWWGGDYQASDYKLNLLLRLILAIKSCRSFIKMCVFLMFESSTTLATGSRLGYMCEHSFFTLISKRCEYNESLFFATLAQ